VRVLSLARVLFALLAFQLAIGLQIGVAHAAMPVTVHATVPVSIPGAVATASTTTATTADDACPLHGSSSQNRSSQGHAAHSAPHAKVFQGAPDGAPAAKHDCCKSSGCQGQCGSVPLAFNIALSRNSPVSTRVQPDGTERVVVAPADTLFRPPILA
jgi:hypothetical protein